MTDVNDIASYVAAKLEDIKSYLRIDTHDDDVNVTTCAKSAVQYIVSAVGDFDESIPTAEMLMLAITQDFYDNRELMQSDQQQKKRQMFMYQSIILQLRMIHELSAEERQTS